MRYFVVFLLCVGGQRAYGQLDHEKGKLTQSRPFGAQTPRVDRELYSSLAGLLKNLNSTLYPPREKAAKKFKTLLEDEKTAFTTAYFLRKALRDPMSVEQSRSVEDLIKFTEPPCDSIVTLLIHRKLVVREEIKTMGNMIDSIQNTLIKLAPSDSDAKAFVASKLTPVAGPIDGNWIVEDAHKQLYRVGVVRTRVETITPIEKAANGKVGDILSQYKNKTVTVEASDLFSKAQLAQLSARGVHAMPLRLESGEFWSAQGEGPGDYSSILFFTPRDVPSFSERVFEFASSLCPNAAEDLRHQINGSGLAGHLSEDGDSLPPGFFRVFEGTGLPRPAAYQNGNL